MDVFGIGKRIRAFGAAQLSLGFQDALALHGIPPIDGDIGESVRAAVAGQAAITTPLAAPAALVAAGGGGEGGGVGEGEEEGEAQQAAPARPKKRRA